jgi:hypothetical protein
MLWLLRRRSGSCVYKGIPIRTSAPNMFSAGRSGGRDQSSNQRH